MRAEQVFENIAARRSTAIAVPLLAGAFSGLGLPPASFPFATVAGMAVAVRLLALAGNWRTAATTGWCFGTGYFLCVMIWLVEPFLVYPDRHAWLAPLALMAMAGGLAVFWSAAFGAAHAVGRCRSTRAVALAVALTAAEGLREFAFTGFPWGVPGTAWSATPVAQAAAYVGPLGLTFFTILAGALLVRDRSVLTGGTAVLAAIGVLWLAGASRQSVETAFSGDRPVVRLVQPNVDQELKWSPAHAERFNGRLLGLTAAEAESLPDLIVWPETGATFLLAGDYDDRLSAIGAAAGGSMVLLGIRRMTDEGVHNSMVMVGQDGQVAASYDKRLLVPFGEYIPFGDFLAGLGATGLATDESGSFSRGTGPAVIEVPVLGSVLAIICYEAIFWSDLRRHDRADVMIQITNDGWFGEFSGPQQHFEQARMRAIELGLPLVRVANTGISAVFDPRGNIVGKIELGREGFLDLEVPEPLAPTMFARFGHGPLFALCLLIAGWMGWRRAAIRR